MSKKTKELRKRAKAANRAAKKEKVRLASRHSADCEAQSAPLSAAAA